MKYSNLLAKLWRFFQPENTQYYCHTIILRFNCILYLQNTLEPLPIEWNSTHNKFQSRDSTSTRYWFYYFNLYFVCVLIGFTSLTVVAINPRIDSNVDVSLTIYSVFLGAVCALMTITITIFAKSVESIVTYSEQFDLLISYLQRVTHGTRRVAPVPVGPFGALGPSFWKRVIVTVISMQIGAFASILIMSPASATYTWIRFTFPFPSSSQVFVSGHYCYYSFVQ